MRHEKDYFASTVRFRTISIGSPPNPLTFIVTVSPSCVQRWLITNSPIETSNVNVSFLTLPFEIGKSPIGPPTEPDSVSPLTLKVKVMSASPFGPCILPVHFPSRLDAKRVPAHPSINMASRKLEYFIGCSMVVLSVK